MNMSNMNRDNTNNESSDSECSWETVSDATDFWGQADKATDDESSDSGRSWETIYDTTDSWPQPDNATNAWDTSIACTWADLTVPAIQVDWERETAADPEEQEKAREPIFETIIIEAAEEFNEFLPILSQFLEGVPELACDCEGGKSFGRKGVLTFFSLTVLSLKKTYILDVCELLKLKVQVFEQENEDGLSLKKVLESEKYLQFWFDARCDWDTLYHKFGITPGRILDLQLMELLSRQGQNYSIFGLYRVMRENGRAFMSEEELEAWLDGKDEGRTYFRHHKLGYGVLEDERPINESTKKYIAGDTDCMFSLFFHLSKKLRTWEKMMQVPKPKKGLEPGAAAESSTEEDWLTFLEKQSRLRAQLAIAPDFDPDDIEGKYRAPAAFTEIYKLQCDMAAER